MNANLRASCTYKHKHTAWPCLVPTQYQAGQLPGREKGSFPASLRVVRDLDVSMASMDKRECMSVPVPDVPPSTTVLLLPAALGASQRRFASRALGRPLQSSWRVD
ncbi:hypothetical protein P4O66_009325 [Electrophorus voltai]|uniref:Uncharacterized protein n=1 Tax=Electrophorus voltai TaxID=2609070 RepID=A0AAD8ZC21_9TELE|nr:hypothetical protein P4O66_009325 [Electrophorus voltai]